MPAPAVLFTIDAATKLGFAFGPVGAQPPLLQWGVRDFGGGRSNGEIISIFRAWLNQRFYEIKPTLCVFETPYVPQPSRVPKPGKSQSPPMNPLVLRRLLGMTGQIEAICSEMRVECRESTTQQFTKFVTGKGRFPGGRPEKKAAVIEACQFYGCDVDGDDNSADALALFLFAESIISPRAADHRRRLAADTHRSINGEGPLFMEREIA